MNRSIPDVDVDERVLVCFMFHPPKKLMPTVPSASTIGSHIVAVGPDASPNMGFCIGVPKTRRADEHDALARRAFDTVGAATSTRRNSAGRGTRAGSSAGRAARHNSHAQPLNRAGLWNRCTSRSLHWPCRKATAALRVPREGQSGFSCNSPLNVAYCSSSPSARGRCLPSGRSAGPAILGLRCARGGRSPGSGVCVRQTGDCSRLAMPCGSAPPNRGEGGHRIEGETAKDRSLEGRAHGMHLSRLDSGMH